MMITFIDWNNFSQILNTRINSFFNLFFLYKQSNKMEEKVLFDIVTKKYKMEIADGPIKKNFRIS